MRLTRDAAVDLLREVTQEPVIRELPPSGSGIDLLMRSAGALFLVELKGNARSDTIAGALSQLERYRGEFPQGEPLLIVPKMGEAGTEICARANVNWLDAAGNASIKIPGLRVHVEGKKADSPLKEVGYNPFSRQASRVVHALLLDPHKDWTRAELVEATNLHKGNVAKSVAALVTASLIIEQRRDGGRLGLRVTNADTLLDAWAERYRRPRPDIYGLLPTIDGFETAQRVAGLLKAAKIDYAFTGLSAAAAYTGFGSFRRASLYASVPIPTALLRELNVSPDARGRNVIVIYDRAGIEVGRQEMADRMYVSPILAYLDLFGEPERAEEAREHLRRYIRERLWVNDRSTGSRLFL